MPMQSFPFCPNSHCVWHSNAPDFAWAKPKGFYTTKAFGRVQRYQCAACHRTFSSQTFSLAYYVKRPVALPDIVARLVSGESLRAMSRNLAVSLNLLSNRIDRLTRQAIALHSICLASRAGYDDICIDGFVSFDTSQYFPSEIPIAITAHSQFILDFSHASRRRSGTMTPAQKAKARELYRRIPLERGALARSFRETLVRALQLQPPAPYRPFVLITDEKPDYQRVLQRLAAFRMQTEHTRLVHWTISSKLPRTLSNPLFSSNYIDRELRKDLAHHHRETVCFNRNVANGMMRLSLYLLGHNYLKPFRIRAHKGMHPRTHAEAAGIPVHLVQHFVQALTGGIRAFLSRCTLSETMRRTWEKRWKTPGKTKAEYIPKYALA
jgi:lambda repressor-like predicted transcriptional regulator